MASLAEAPVRPSRLRDVFRVDRYDRDVGLVNQQVEFAPAGLAFPGLDDESHFEQGGGRRRRLARPRRRASVVFEGDVVIREAVGKRGSRLIHLTLPSGRVDPTSSLEPGR